ncbi:uncharacterized protein [Haliotis asinina]|uniref:uncharacterized protein n=1 Tax=Haliotis asinina TaxID=109174 RepID=UPI0035317EEA
MEVGQLVNRQFTLIRGVHKVRSPDYLDTEASEPCTFNNADSVSVVYCESDCCDNTCCTYTDGQSSVAVVVLSVLAAAVGVVVVAVIVVACYKGRLQCSRWWRDKQPLTVSPAQGELRNIDKTNPFDGGSFHSDKPPRQNSGAMIREGTFSIFS